MRQVLWGPLLWRCPCVPLAGLLHSLQHEACKLQLSDAEGCPWRSSRATALFVQIARSSIVRIALPGCHFCS